MADVYHGIDFSGGAAPWRMRCARPSVWVATIAGAEAPRLLDVRPVQALPGDGTPFAKLVALLRQGAFVAAGIDAPFSLPARHLPSGGHPALLRAVAALPAAPDRPFPSGAALVALAESIAPLVSSKPLRETEQIWRRRGVNTRSTLWNGPRGGAPFAAACLTLLAQAARPVWPWARGTGMLVESFPAAQLRRWGLPHTGYAAPDQRAARAVILDGLGDRIAIGAVAAELLLASADALDAVIAGFGAIAAGRGTLPALVPLDGLISVMD